MSDPRRDIEALARQLEPTEAEAASLKARINATRAEAPKHRLRPVLVAGAALFAATAAITTLVARQDEEPRVIRDIVAWEQATTGVWMKAAGLGVLDREEAIAIAWTEGTLSLRTEPGVAVQVRTAEADVSATGAELTVDRHVHGTSIAVTGGSVRVACGGVEAPKLLEGGSTAHCLASAAAGLARVVELRRSGADADAVLDAIELANDYTTTAPIRTELDALYVLTLAATGRAQATLTAAEPWLDRAPSPRRDEVLGAAARVAMSQGCAPALPYLRSMPTDVTALVLLHDCIVAHDPGEAREALERAMDSATTHQQRQQISLRMDRLPRR